MIRFIALRLLETYFRHRWLYLIPIVLMIGFAGYYIYNMKPVYVSQGVVSVTNNSLLSTINPLPNDNNTWWITPSQAASNEMMDLLRTDAFVRAIIKETDLEKEMTSNPEEVKMLIDDVRNNMWTAPLGDNQLQITAQNLSPEVAYQLVNSFIQNFLQWKINSSRIESLAAQDFFANLITDYERDLSEARDVFKDFLVNHPEPIKGERLIIETLEIDRFQREISFAENRYTSALDKDEEAKLVLKQVETDIQQTYVLIDAPLLPTKPELSKRGLAINLAVFLAVGIVIFIGLVTLTTILDRTIRLPQDLSNHIDLPVLGILQDMKPIQKRAWKRLPFRKRSHKSEKTVFEDQLQKVKGSIPNTDIDQEADAPA